MNDSLNNFFIEYLKRYQINHGVSQKHQYLVRTVDVPNEIWKKSAKDKEKENGTMKEIELEISERRNKVRQLC